MDAKTIVADIQKAKGDITQIYWVACGGSVIDLYPAHVMVTHESERVESGIYTSREFTLLPPKRLGPKSLVVVCSHSGGTPETLAAAEYAHKSGASVVSLTYKPESKIVDARYINWVYPWGDDVPTAQIPSGITLLLAGELIDAREGFGKQPVLRDGITKMDGILRAARKKINDGPAQRFAELCQQHRFFYILGSGATFSQTYGFAICSMMEMQRQHCAYIHSGEYFHGPFEVTENGVFHFLQVGSGFCREMDLRALAFLKTHTDALMTMDAIDYGMDAIDPSVRDYLDPVLFYLMNVELRAARGRLFNHPVETRRYMGIEKY